MIFAFRLNSTRKGFLENCQNALVSHHERDEVGSFSGIFLGHQ